MGCIGFPLVELQTDSERSIALSSSIDTEKCSAYADWKLDAETNHGFDICLSIWSISARWATHSHTQPWVLVWWSNTVSSLLLSRVSQHIIPISDHSERDLDARIQYVLLTHTHTHTEPSQQSSVRFGFFEAEQKCSNVTAWGDRLLAPWHPYYSLLPSSLPAHPALPTPSSWWWAR